MLKRHGLRAQTSGTFAVWLAVIPEQRHFKPHGFFFRAEFFRHIQPEVAEFIAFLMTDAQREIIHCCAVVNVDGVPQGIGGIPLLHIHGFEILVEMLWLTGTATQCEQEEAVQGLSFHRNKYTS